MTERPAGVDPWEWGSVLADQLCETDPARGQYAQLQLHGTESALTEAQRHERDALYAEEHHRWIEPVSSGLIEGRYRFLGGYLDVANVYPKSRAHARELGASPHWATVRQMVAPRHLRLLLASGRFTSLETLGTAFQIQRDGSAIRPSWGRPLRVDRVAGLRLPPTVTSLNVDLGSEARCMAFLNTFGVGALAGIDTVGIVCRGTVSKRILEDFPRDIVRLMFDVLPDQEPLWVRRAEQLFPALERLEVVRDGRLVSAGTGTATPPSR